MTEEKSKLEKKNKTLLKLNLNHQVNHLAVQVQKARSSGVKFKRGKSKRKTKYSQRWL